MDWNAIASTATAIGVFVAAWQIWESRKLSQTSFEDSLDQQYRELSRNIPVDVLIGKDLDENKIKETREVIYNYLDLCNEQIYLRSKKRIGKERWEEWSKGIKENLERSGFQQVWLEVKKEAPATFSFLEELENEQFKKDPVDWKH